MADYREEVQKKASSLRPGSSTDEVRDVWKQVLEYIFPKQSADCPRQGFVHNTSTMKANSPTLVSSILESLPTAEAEKVLPGTRTPWQALEEAVQYELVGIMSLIKECKPNLSAIIVAGPLVRFYGVNKRGEFWDLDFDAEEGAWNIHDDFDAILEGLLTIRAKMDRVCSVPFGVSTVCIKEEPVEGQGQ